MADLEGSGEVVVKKEKRAINWTTQQKTDLIDLISARIGSIENKKNDFRSNARKLASWEEIFTQFSSKYGILRDLAALKTQWKRCKAVAKKEHSSFKIESLLTGGGPPPPPLSTQTQIICQLCPRDFDQIRNPFDDDSAAMGKMEALTPTEFLLSVGKENQNELPSTSTGGFTNDK